MPLFMCVQTAFAGAPTMCVIYDIIPPFDNIAACQQAAAQMAADVKRKRGAAQIGKRRRYTAGERTLCDF